MILFFSKIVKGFTILEVVAALLVLSVVVALASVIFVQGIKGYIFAEENAALSQKIQLALDRMNLEFENIIDINEIQEIGDPYICYTLRIDTFQSDGYRCLGFHQNEIKMIIDTANPIAAPDFSNGITLLDNVAQFQLDYYDADDPNTDIPFTNKGNWSTSPIGILADLYSIKIDIRRNHLSSGSQLVFSSSVNTRRSGRFNGPPEWSR